MHEWKGFLPPNAILMAKPGIKPGSKPAQKRVAKSNLNAGVTPQAKNSLGNSPLTSTRPSSSTSDRTSLETYRATSVGAKLVFVGDAIQGQASQLLDKMIEAMGVPRAEVAILSAEAARALDLTSPHIFVALGEKTTQALLQSSGSQMASEPFANLRSRFLEYRGSKLISVFHPSELLKSPLLKKDVWQDLQKVVKEMGIQLPKK